MIIISACMIATVGTVIILGLYFSSKSGEFVSISSRKFATDTAKEMILEKATAVSFEIDSELEVGLDTARILADVFSGIKDPKINLKIDRKRINDILQSLLEKNPSYIGIYTCWEPNALDQLDDIYVNSEGHDKTGRFIPYWSRDSFGKIKVAPLEDYESHEKHENGVRKGDYYLLPKETQKECAIDPYPYNVQGKTVWMTSLVAPVIVKGVFFGIAGVDMDLKFIQSLTEKANKEVYGGSGNIVIVSYNGLVIAASNNESFVGKHLMNIKPDNWQQILRLIQKSDSTVELSNKYVEATVPLHLGTTGRPWGVIVNIPKESVFKHADALDKELSTRNKDTIFWQVLIGIGVVIAAMLIVWTISGLFVRPINQAKDRLKDIAEGQGDLTARLNVDRDDEVGKLAESFNRFIENLQKMIKNIAVNIETLNTASEELNDLSFRLASGSEQMSNQSNNVAGATEQMSANINAMAAAVEQMSANAHSVSSTAEQLSVNMNSVASAIEEMSMAIRDVSKNAQDGASIAKKAADMSNSASHTMNLLGDAAKEIGQVTTVIKRIAEQTNLLALNATIEAASAGDAGRGFAVVANEIKELANQSAKAAEDISQRIEGVQKNTQEAVRVISEVSVIINKVNESSMLITKSVEQQTITANEISGNVQQANAGVNNIASAISEIAKGTEDVAKNAGDAAKGVNDISSNIQGVSKAASDLSKDAHEVKMSAEKLRQVAGVLRNMVKTFKVE